MKIRTRFAPSPTGYLHIGAVRTALYSWLFARNHGGKFILRIDNTDLIRSTQKAIENIINDMTWLNLEWDEGPYFQEKRSNRYNEVIDSMLAAGTAYKCYCSKENLFSLRAEQVAKGEKPHYNGYCRYNVGRYANNKPYVVRFANPQEGYVTFNDLVYCQIQFKNKELDDLIIRRSDGSHTYNFCVVVDDWDMAITHVIRGEDHINNTPRQINIFKALNAPIPIYAHVSMINGKNGKKLSKRHGAVSVKQYRDDGYLPEALLNYILRLGWSHGNQEIFSREEMIKLFSLKTINKSASIFNINKLLWLNQHYMNVLSPKCIMTHLQLHLKQENININNGPEITEVIKLFSKRYKTLKEIAKNCHYFYDDSIKFNQESAEKYLNLTSQEPLKKAHDKLYTINEWTVENIHHVIQTIAVELKINMSDISMPLRVAITGNDQSPTLETIIYLIGKLRCIKRINNALNFIKQQI